jgi:hypothetical protein
MTSLDRINDGDSSTDGEDDPLQDITTFSADEWRELTHELSTVLMGSSTGGGTSRNIPVLSRDAPFMNAILDVLDEGCFTVQSKQSTWKNLLGKKATVLYYVLEEVDTEVYKNIVTFGIQSARSWLNEGGFEQWKKSFKISIAKQIVDEFTEVVRAQLNDGDSSWSRASVHQLQFATSRAIDHTREELEGLSVEGQTIKLIQSVDIRSIDMRHAVKQFAGKGPMTVADGEGGYVDVILRVAEHDECSAQADSEDEYPDSLASEDVTESASLSSPSDRKASLKSLSNRKIFPGPDRLEEGGLQHALFDHTGRSPEAHVASKLRFEDDNTNHDQSTISRGRKSIQIRDSPEAREKYANRELKHIRHRQDHYVDMNDPYSTEFRKTEQRWLNPDSVLQHQQLLLRNDIKKASSELENKYYEDPMNRMHPTQEMLNLNAEIVDLYKTQLRMLKELPENSPYRKELIDTCEGQLSLANNRFRGVENNVHGGRNANVSSLLLITATLVIGCLPR